MRLKPLDYLILAAAASLSVYLIFNGFRQVSNLRLIVTQDQKTWVYSLDQDTEGDIPGPLGDTHFVIREGHVDVTDSPCPNKTCVTSGEIHRHNQWIACLPNGILFRIEGAAEEESEVDIHAY